MGESRLSAARMVGGMVGQVAELPGIEGLMETTMPAAESAEDKTVAIISYITIIDSSPPS